MALSFAERIQIQRADEQCNSTSTKLDIQWGVSPNRETSLVCRYEGCTLGKDGGRKRLDANNGTGFCRDHWKIGRNRRLEGRHSPSNESDGV